MRGIFIESLRGAIIRILRMLIYMIIIALVLYFIGFFTSKKNNKESGGINVNQIMERL